MPERVRDGIPESNTHMYTHALTRARTPLPLASNRYKGPSVSSVIGCKPKDNETSPCITLSGVCGVVPVCECDIIYTII